MKNVAASTGFTSEGWKKFSFLGDKSILPKRPRLVCMFGIAVLSAALCSPAGATEWFVAAGSMGGNGTKADPFGKIEEGLSAAQPGDTVTVGGGVYSESLRTVRGGTSSLPIRLRASGIRGS